jgi:hypothetical protein
VSFLGTMSHPRQVVLSLLLVLAAGQGCYRYHAVQLPGLETGEDVRIELRQAEYRRIAPGSAFGGPGRMKGRFGGVRQDSLVLSVWIGEGYQGTPFASAFQDLVIPLADVVAVENRQLSKGRTGVVAAGVVALAAVLIDSVGLVEIFGSGGGEGPPQPPEPEGSVIGR